MTYPVNVTVVKLIGSKHALSSPKNIVQGGVGAVTIVETIPIDGLCWPLPSSTKD